MTEKIIEAICLTILGLAFIWSLVGKPFIIKHVRKENNERSEKQTDSNRSKSRD